MEGPALSTAMGAPRKSSSPLRYAVCIWARICPWKEFSSDTKLGCTLANEGLSVNICCGESPEGELLAELSIDIPGFTGVDVAVTGGVDFVVIVCVFPPKIENSSLLSSGREGLKMSLRLFGATPLLRSRKAFWAFIWRRRSMG